MRKPQRRRLTKKQKRLVKAMVLDPNATLDELGQSSDYHDKANVSRALKAPAVVDALAKCRELMDQREKLTLGALLTHLEDGLEATDIRSLKVEGEKFKVSAEVKDFPTRHKYLTSAFKLRGLEKPEQDASPSGPVNIAIILAGGGSEAEKTALADALLAARLARGLHPLENRNLTPDEAASYRRSP